jgi:hypothetical protein
MKDKTKNCAKYEKRKKKTMYLADIQYQISFSITCNKEK